jgi:hypothetical protein
MKTAEAKDAALDLLVAKCENVEPDENNRPIWFGDGDERVEYTPSTDWAQGGPIIEREGITVSVGSPVTGLEWMACDRGSTHIQHGPTYLIAAMRCYVASKLGDNIDIPEELL